MRIGIIGYGYIGADLVRRIEAIPDRLQIAFVNNRTVAALAGLDAEYALEDLGAAASRTPDLIVECAHPDITRNFGETFLACANYLPLSVTALADDRLRQRLLETAGQNDTKLLLPAGALIGGAALHMRSQPWRRVRITFRKHPNNIDFSDSDFSAAAIRGETLLFEGSVRQIARLYPRNVNTMVTCALLSTGLDACEARLFADPALDCAVAEVEAWNQDGGEIRTIKRQPAVGVSGTEMLDSVWYSVLGASRQPTDGLQLV